MFTWTSNFIFGFDFFLGIERFFCRSMTLAGYVLYRFSACIYYSELKINEESGKTIKSKKILDKTLKTEVITDKFDPRKLEFLELKRSGLTKFLMIYRTYKTHELLVLRNESDKEHIQKYVLENIMNTTNNFKGND